jgi:crossover junction endodeoxyribonuclease RuvC
MVVLGIDPGFSVTGFGVAKKDGRSLFLIDYGYLRMSSTKPLAERVHIFYECMGEKIVRHGVTDIALETPFLGKNAQNFLKLGYLRGIMYLLSQQHNLNLHEFAPREVKASVTGSGAASKEQVARVLSRLFPKLGPQEKLDVTDALAVMLCGAWKSKKLIL